MHVRGFSCSMVVLFGHPGRAFELQPFPLFTCDCKYRTLYHTFKKLLHDASSWLLEVGHFEQPEIKFQYRDNVISFGTIRANAANVVICFF